MNRSEIIDVIVEDLSSHGPLSRALQKAFSIREGAGASGKIPASDTLAVAVALQQFIADNVDMSAESSDSALGTALYCAVLTQPDETLQQLAGLIPRG